MFLTVIYVVLYVLGIGASIWGRRETANFLRLHREIRSEASLEAFKELARGNMRLALVTIPVLVLGTLLGLVLIVRHGVLAGVGVVLTNAVLLIAGQMCGRLEKRARSLPAANETLAQEQRRVIESWQKKALPDF